MPSLNLHLYLPRHLHQAGPKSTGTLRNSNRMLKVPSLPFKGTSLQEVNLRGNKNSNKNNCKLGA